MSRLAVLKSKLVPKALPRYHKGQLGKLVVIGGCEDYTGAPFFSAIAAITLGCDLVHVLCSIGAGSIIKSYSPDLMVHPYLMEEGDTRRASAESRMVSLLQRMDVAVIGPGLGRDSMMKNQMVVILRFILETDMPVVLDADSLYHISNTPELVSLIQNCANRNVVMTPNVVEFQRLAEAAEVSSDLQEVSKFFNCTVIQKGEVDRICTRGGEVLSVSEKGSLKRVGGQGDTLTGILGTLLCWGMGTYKRGDWVPESEVGDSEGHRVHQLSDEEIVSTVCVGGCYLTRKTCHLAYEKYGRAMLTSQIHHSIQQAWSEFHGDKY